VHATPKITVVTPCLNEAESLPGFLRDLRENLDDLEFAYEVVVVDDGSSDSSWEVIAATEWPQLRAVRLLANRGHQVALDAGLRAAKGDFVVTMDSDGQHPPAVIRALLTEAIAKNVDVVYAVRSDRSDDGWAKRQTAIAYYRLMRGLTGVPLKDSAADFRIMSRFVVDVLNTVPEQKVFRLLLPYLGFTSSSVDYQARQRIHGASKYSLRRMVALATRSSIQFSTKPLRMVTATGFIMAVLAVLWLGWVLVDFAYGRTVAGWASQMAVTLIVGGLTLFSLGILGEYVGEIFERVSGRPSFLVRETLDGSARDRTLHGEVNER